MLRIETAPEATLSLPPIGNSVMAAMSNAELGTRLDDLFRFRAALEGHIVQLLGEADRRGAHYDDGSSPRTRHRRGSIDGPGPQPDSPLAAEAS